MGQLINSQVAQKEQSDQKANKHEIIIYFSVASLYFYSDSLKDASIPTISVHEALCNDHLGFYCVCKKVRKEAAHFSSRTVIYKCVEMLLNVCM